VALESAKHRVSTFYQGAEMTTTEYVEYFTALVGVVETFGGRMDENQAWSRPN
jgi:hypothetical protein